MQLVNSAIGSNNDLMFHFTISSSDFFIDKIVAAFSFKKEKQLNQIKIDELIQLIFFEFNKQLLIYHSELFSDQIDVINKIDVNSLIEQNEIIEIQKKYEEFFDQFVDYKNKVTLINKICDDSFKLVSFEVKSLIKTQKNMYLGSTILFIIIINIMFLVFSFIKKND